MYTVFFRLFARSKRESSCMIFTPQTFSRVNILTLVYCPRNTSKQKKVKEISPKSKASLLDFQELYWVNKESF